MTTFFWKLEHFLIIGLRQPKAYLFVSSSICAQIFTSLKISDPIKQYISTIPHIVFSDSIANVIFFVIFGILFYFISWLLSSLFGYQPFEFLANHIDSLKEVPSFTSYIESRLKGKSIYSTEGSYRLKIAQGNDLSTFNQINRDLFRFTLFSLPLQIINKRNNEIFKANKLTTAVIEAQVSQTQYTPIGISHVVPLNSLGKTQYVMNNGLKDSQIRFEHVSKPQEWSNAIVLFSMGILPPCRRLIKNRYLAIVFIFLEHLTNLISEMRLYHPTKTCTYIYVQTEKSSKGIGRILSLIGFQKLDIISGDGHRIWEIKLDIPQDISNKNVLMNFWTVSVKNKLSGWIDRINNKN